MRERAQKFFDLPLQEKKRCAQKPGSLEGYSQAFVTSVKQKLPWNECSSSKSSPSKSKFEFLARKPSRVQVNSS